MVIKTLPGVVVKMAVVVLRKKIVVMVVRLVVEVLAGLTSVPRTRKTLPSVIVFNRGDNAISGDR